MTLTVIAPGLETSIQDWPGRRGFINQGFPISGPFDSWSFRLANRLVGNEPDTAALECQFLGPTLRFDVDAVISLTGAEMTPRLDGAPIETWTSVAVRAGQTLALGPARIGARTYIAVAGGISNPTMLGSRSTFHKAGVGGLGGKALAANQSVPIGNVTGLPPAGRRVDPSRRPPIAGDGRWTIEVVLGPNDDWISAEGHERFFSTEWKLSAKSDRTGMRLEGPDWLFAPRAIDKPPENGKAPSNIIDQGYPLGAINLAGSTPIILPVDGPSMGGFINPYTVITAALWKLAQARPGNLLRFVALEVDAAQERARDLARLCGPEMIS